MATSSEQMRAWRGPALLTYGFRPFFLGGAVWAIIAMALWIAMMTGAMELPTAFDPVSWHAHEFLFGYLGAVAAGFLLTAVPNWTGRLPLVGWPLGGLFASWIAGRFAVGFSAGLPALAVALVDLALPIALCIFIGREIIAGRNWRNLIVLGLLSALILANAIFHFEAARGDFAAQGYGMRFGISVAVMMIAVIGGRIVPSFTRNWLARRGDQNLPVPPMQQFDRLALLGLLAALVLWILWPQERITGLALLLAGLLHLIRLSRWRGERTGAEPLVWVLHLGYAFIPIGALVMALALLWPETLLVAGTAQHLWMAGGIGMMTLAVMTRATLGHSGRELHADTLTAGIYLALLVSVIARLAMGIYPEHDWPFQLAAIAWLAAYCGFTLHFGPILLRPLQR